MKEIDYEDEINSNINIDIDKNINIAEEKKMKSVHMVGLVLR